MLWYGLGLIVGIFRAERLVQQLAQEKQATVAAAATGSWAGLGRWPDLLLGRNGDDGLRVLFLPCPFVCDDEHPRGRISGAACALPLPWCHHQRERQVGGRAVRPR